MGKLNILTRGIIKENPVLVLLLGTCPTLATTTSALNGLGMGVAAMAVHRSNRRVRIRCADAFKSVLTCSGCITGFVYTVDRSKLHNLGKGGDVRQQEFSYRFRS